MSHRDPAIDEPGAALDIPALPDIPALSADIHGVRDYAGTVMHSASWDREYDFAGKSVAVIGTGASAVRIIPELVRLADRVKVFQRSPAWVLPRLDFPHPYWVTRLFRQCPAATSLVRAAALAHLRVQVKDRWLRRQLTPDLRAGRPRMLVSSDYYPALQAANCKLITWPIVRLSERGIRTAEGIEHHADAIVFAG